MTHIGLLKTLASIFSPSGNEEKMIKYLMKFCKRIPNTIFGKDEYGNLYVTKGIAESYPCVVAHCDQVSHVHHDKDFTCVDCKGVLFGYSPGERRMNNCGWDDKAGIAIALLCLKEFDNIKVAFFREEEVGTIGSSNADMEFFSDCKFVIEPDRRGNNDLITTISLEELCSEDFLNAINYDFYGYHKEDGLMTDILSLKENGLAVSCINLSCGYYHPHTNEEVLVYSDWENCLNFVMSIIESCDDIYPHESSYSGYDNYNSSYFGYFSSKHKVTKQEAMDSLAYDIVYYFKYDDNLSFEDVLDYAKGEYPNLTKEDVQSVYVHAMSIDDDYECCEKDDNSI